jgi:hypothetical protein
VSTSRKKDEASKFALSRKEARGIILVYLIPEPLEKYGISRNTVVNFKTQYQHTGLPLYSDNFYPHQDEIAIRGALFPQFILGFEDLEHNYFVLNPYLLSSNISPGYVPIHGLPIDQSKFEEVLKGTSYYAYVSLWHRSNFSDSFP